MAIQTALNRISREIGVKRCLIIDGNVDDLFLDEKGKLSTLTDYLKDKLDGYDVICWDSVNHLTGNLDHLQLEVLPEQSGDVYELDDGTPNSASRKDNVQNVIKADSPKDIFNVIRINMSSKSAFRFAFIVDWADYIFGSSTSTDSPEREWLTMLGKSLNGKPKSMSLSADENVVIFITRSLAMFPVSFYQKNSQVSCITISRPDREERKRMYEKYFQQFAMLPERDSLKRNNHVDMMEDFTNREILQMAMMSKKNEKVSFEKLFFLFKYGEKDNPWEKLDYNAICGLKEELRRRVIGQDEAIAKVENVVIKAYMGLTGIHKSSSRNAPKGVLFFVGPTGVGKTELSKALAKFLFGDEQACIRFDMSEYAQETSDQKLIGAPPGYVGYEQGGQLTNAVREKPFSIILFDEIEKAAKPNPRILDIFLQILEDGRLTDNKGETVYFSESVIIFTSNLGAADIKSEGTNEQIANRFISEVRRYFNEELKRPELLGRIGNNNIVPFNFIKDVEFSKKIAKSKLQPIKDFIKEKFRLDLMFEDESQFIDFVLSNADQSKGGRDILNAINDTLLDDLAKFLFLNKENLKDLEGSELRVIVEDGKINFIWPE